MRQHLIFSIILIVFMQLFQFASCQIFETGFCFCFSGDQVQGMRRLHLTDRHLRVMLWCILLGLQPAFGGILDPFNWARSDRIEVNIPWLPCKFLGLICLLSALVSVVPLQRACNRQLSIAAKLFL